MSFAESGAINTPSANMQSGGSLDETHDPTRKSWIDSANGHPDFPVQNLPLGIFSPQGRMKRVGTAIGDQVLDVKACADAGLFDPFVASACGAPALNALLGLPAFRRRALRRCISELLSDPSYRNIVENKLYPVGNCDLHLPTRIGNYSDFYAGIHHAANVGRQFRPDSPLLPNYKHVPIGYHGRASSVRPSGVPVVRPVGQSMARGAVSPAFGPTEKLDYELELGIWVGSGNRLGTPIPLDEAAGHIAGFCLLNDWSARDFQSWEYQPLGPFLSKSFHTTISPWVVTLDAMAPFRMAQSPRPAGDPAPLPYLSSKCDQSSGGLALTLEVFLSTSKMAAEGATPVKLSHGSAADMYWSVAQLLTHHASNGCNLMPGDLLGSGTISSPEREGFGSLLEISEGGQNPFTLPNGEARSFLEDGDEVMFKARASAEGFVSIGFGTCSAKVHPAHQTTELLRRSAD